MSKGEGVECSTSKRQEKKERKERSGIMVKDGQSK